ncbi:hypothetical protein MNBD_ALPHA05-980, partial [hydrothermal vent metagenome]
DGSAGLLPDLKTFWDRLSSVYAPGAFLVSGL